MASTQRGDVVVYSLVDGKMKLVDGGKIKGTDRADRPNFVIVCDYGDWSGFRTLADCERQFPELEEVAAKRKFGDRYYQVVER